MERDGKQTKSMPVTDQCCDFKKNQRKVSRETQEWRVILSRWLGNTSWVRLDVDRDLNKVIYIHIKEREFKAYEMFKYLINAMLPQHNL